MTNLQDTNTGSNPLPATLRQSNSPCAVSTPTPRSDLQPVGLKEGTNELAACLTLVAPTGMSEAERGQWIAVARQTLKGIPADLMRWGCEAARKKCRFPSEIVPAILEAVQPSWDRRLRQASVEADRLERMSIPALPKPDKITADQAAAVLIEFGLNRADN